jgi:hypothetical protein
MSADDYPFCIGGCGKATDDADKPCGDPLCCAVAKVRRSCAYWAPEIRRGKLRPYIFAWGAAFVDRIRALPLDEQRALGMNV